MSAVPRVSALTPEHFVAQVMSRGDPRSPEYVSGFLDLVSARWGGRRLPPSPYPVASAARDAWFAGVERGQFELRRLEASAD